jgi:hypothetical protein
MAMSASEGRTSESIPTKLERKNDNSVEKSVSSDRLFIEIFCDTFSYFFQQQLLSQMFLPPRNAVYGENRKTNALIH